jgi:predicted transcriptional regulator
MPRAASKPAPRRNFHVPLPDDLYRALQTEAARSKKPANAVAREAIAQWLEARRQAQIDEDILAYAAETAGAREDLDPELEAAGLELLADDV